MHQQLETIGMIDGRGALRKRKTERKEAILRQEFVQRHEDESVE